MSRQTTPANRKARRFLWLAVGVAALLAASNAGAQANAPAAPAAEARKPDRLVLAWNMMCYGSSVERHKQHIEIAQRHGIDGFWLDVGGWGAAAAVYKPNCERVYEAAKQLGTGFKLAMAPEYMCFAKENVVDMVMTFKDHPNQLRQDGRPVLGAYILDHNFKHDVQPILKALEDQGVKVFFVPSACLMSRPRFSYNATFEGYLDLFKTPGGSYFDGLQNFVAHQIGVNLNENALGRRVTQYLGKLYSAGVIVNYNSANLEDYRGLGGYLDMWQGAINDGADWINLIIWNDYNEDSALMPGRWPWGSERHLFSRDESYLHATAYASAWFKSGQRPAITQDRYFVTYKNRSLSLRKAWDAARKTWVDQTYEARPYDQIHDDAHDLVYVDSFLTAPATLTVQLGGKTHKFELPAGVGRAALPVVPGTPRLTLERGGKVLAETVGRRQILGPDDVNERNSLASYHHIFRTWTGGTALGPVVKRLEAEAGTLGPQAAVVEEGKIKAAKPAMAKYDAAARSIDIKKTMAQHEGTITLPVEGLTTATYNVRVSHRNPGPGEARLALIADGVGLGQDDFPYFMPVWLPPTEGDTFATVSFFMTLYDSTRALKLQMLPGHYFSDAVPADDDYGSALIDAVELVRVEPIVLPKVASSIVPELVLIPGGKFTMGADDGEPDEQPRHEVTVSGFAMAKCEVTNEEFERFAPDHRAMRNGNSWRDREPVVAVSWEDAVAYCNWLSEKTGLTPVYKMRGKHTIPYINGNFWTKDAAADGFRLPTEAEWEYEATGRGEGRKYPWGNAAPVPYVHGNFMAPADAQGPRLPRRAVDANGVVAVGSYPAGASRDGILDLAGNVAEWCFDFYNCPYPAEPQTDPISKKPSVYQVMRGGSWSYYGSPRATDRQYNTATYPGHAYYGFRVVVSSAGYEKLTKTPAADAAK